MNFVWVSNGLRESKDCKSLVEQRCSDMHEEKKSSNPILGCSPTPARAAQPAIDSIAAKTRWLLIHHYPFGAFSP